METINKEERNEEGKGYWYDPRQENYSTLSEKRNYRKSRKDNYEKIAHFILSGQNGQSVVIGVQLQGQEFVTLKRYAV